MAKQQAAAAKPTSLGHLMPEHPSPQRGAVGALPLLLPVFAPPLAWSAHFLTNIGLSSAACLPHQFSTPQDVSAFTYIWLAISGVMAFCICAASAALAYRNWRLVSGERGGREHVALEVGEGRSRFLAVVGLIFGTGFAFVIAVDIAALLIVPICAR